MRLSFRKTSCSSAEIRCGLCIPRHSALILPILLVKLYMNTKRRKSNNVTSVLLIKLSFVTASVEAVMTDRQTVKKSSFIMFLVCMVLMHLRCNLSVESIFHMGTASSSHADIDIAEQFVQLGRQRSGLLMKEANSEDTFLLKQLTFASEEHYSKERNRLEKEQKKGSRQHILSVHKVKTHTVQGLCSTIHKIFVVYEFPSLTLQDQLIERSQSGKHFDEQELMSIALCCVKALEQSPGLSLSCRQIFITNEGDIKAIHKDLTDEIWRLHCTEGVLYAPQKMKHFNRYDNPQTLKREVVFSAGMTLLEAARLEPVTDCYDYHGVRFKQGQLECLVQNLGESYSCQFIQMIEGMLSINPSKRTTLTQLTAIMDQYWAEEEVQSTKARSESGRVIFTASERRGALRELPTVQSTQQQSVPFIKITEANSKSGKQWSGTGVGSLAYISANSNTSQGENIYTDPKLLEWIRQDVSMSASNLPKQSFLKTSQQDVFESIGELQVKKTMAVNESMNMRGSSGGRKNCFPVSQVSSVRLDEEEGVYEGYTMNGSKHGWGRMTYKEGGYYEGEFKDGQINGQGILYYEDGSKAYSGQWWNGAFHGYGTIYNQCPTDLPPNFDGSDFDEMGDGWVKYQGIFEEDCRCGSGRLELVGGAFWEGRFKGDMLQGQGVFHSMDKVVKGTWQSNCLVSIDEQ